MSPPACTRGLLCAGTTGARRHRRLLMGEPHEPARRSALSPGALPLEVKGNPTTWDRRRGQARPDHPGCEQGRRRGRLPIGGSSESQSQPACPARPMVGLSLGLCSGISLAVARAQLSAGLRFYKYFNSTTVLNLPDKPNERKRYRE